MERASDERAFFGRDGEGRCKEDVIAANAVNAAARRIGQYIFFQTSLVNFIGDILFLWKGFARGFVFDELDAEKKAEPANFANVRMRLQGGKSAAQDLPGRNRATKKIVRFEIIENRVARGGGDGMRLICEAMRECARAAAECFDHTSRNQHSAERRVPAGDSFAHQNHVWLDAPVLDGKGFSGAAHAGHDFVGDQENSVLAADFRDARGVALRRRRSAKRRANDRFENESGGFIWHLSAQMNLKIIGASEFTLRKRFFERAVVAEARSNVSPFREKWFVRGAACDIPAYGHRAEGAAVIALTSRNDAITRGLPAFEMKLPDELDGGFRGFRSARSEIHAAAGAKIRRGEREEALR